MPRVLQPGGLLRNMRVCYTARRKLGLLASAKRIMEEEGVTLRQAAEGLNVSHSLFVKWRQQQAADVDPILAMLKSKRKVAYVGPLGQLKPLEQALLRYIFEHPEQGMTVHTFNLVVKVSSLSPEFSAKHFVARCSAMKLFMRVHSLVYRMGTHQTQRKPEEVVAEALDYMNLIRTLLLGPHRNRHFILNMDQTPLYFCMTRKKTLEVVGVTTVHVRTSTSDMKCVTVAVTIAADGTVLPSTIVFKGKRMVRLRGQSSAHTRQPTTTIARTLPGWMRGLCSCWSTRYSNRTLPMRRSMSFPSSLSTATAAT
jgi:hypothetical protein